MTEDKPIGFGGNWTKRKLDILESYMDAYTTALKKQGFRLMYIDAFAGEGRIGLRDDDDGVQFLSGSVTRALKIEDRLFTGLSLSKKIRQYTENSNVYVGDILEGKLGLKTGMQMIIYALFERTGINGAGFFFSIRLPLKSNGPRLNP